MKHAVVGIDIATRVFRLHRVELESVEMVSVQLKRAKFLQHFASRAPCRVGSDRVTCRLSSDHLLLGSHGRIGLWL